MSPSDTTTSTPQNAAPTPQRVKVGDRVRLLSPFAQTAAGGRERGRIAKIAHEDAIKETDGRAEGYGARPGDQAIYVVPEGNPDALLPLFTHEVEVIS